MTYKEVVDKVADARGISKVDAKAIIETFCNVVKNGVKADEKISIPDFGTFTKGHRSERQGINPATKEAITIPAKDVAKFKPAPKFLG